MGNAATDPPLRPPRRAAPPRLPRAAACLLACLLPLALGCATSGSRAAGEEAVRIVSTTPATPGEGGGEEAADAGAPPEGVDTPATSAEVLEQALAWAAEGLRQYEAGELEAARHTLSDVRIKLTEASLPPAMAERGLAVLDCCLPADLAHHDLAAVAELLEREAEPDAAELAERAWIEREVRRILARFGETAPQPRYLEVFVSEVERYVDYYRGRQREFFERAFQRKHKYQPIIDEVFTASNLPLELGYLALVESGYNPRAVSRAQARGLWQFIDGTGRRYQLQHREDFYDARLSTEAAAEYLLDLIGIFGRNSFLLAIAAYNSGEGRIVSCLRGLDDPFEGRNFWEIRGCLAQETREYVPRVLAAAVIAADPARFGFQLPGEEEVRSAHDVVVVPRVTALATLAELAGTDVGSLRAANTDLASTATATPGRNFPLYVPHGAGERVTAALADPGAVRRAAAPEVNGRLAAGAAEADGSAPAPRIYTVRRGDTLSEIAHRYGITVADLERWNPTAEARRLRPGDRLTVGGAGGAPVIHRVAAGETLSGIAGRYGLLYRQVADWNGLAPPYRLRVGQELRLDTSDGGPPPVFYTVRAGNTLETIAELFAVRYRDIMAWNHLDSPVLRAGQRLRIHPPRPYRAHTYRVRRGDTVARIARRFGVATGEVLIANGLGHRSVIRPGQQLVVYVPG